MTVYLAGPINGCSDSEALDWRDELTHLLGDYDTISPMTRDYRGKEDANVDAIVDGDKVDMDSSATVVAYCPRPSVGTSMEILYAWERGKRVITYVPPGSPISPWLRYHSHVIVHNLADVALELSRDLSCE